MASINQSSQFNSADINSVFKMTWDPAKVKIDTPPEDIQCPYPDVDASALEQKLHGVGKVFRASQASDQIKKITEKVEIMKYQLDIENLKFDIEEAQSRVTELETACKQTESELASLSTQLKNMEDANAPIGIKLSEADIILYNLNAKAAGAKSTIDTINSLKQEIEVLELKKEVATNMMEIVEMQENVYKKSGEACDIEKALATTMAELEKSMNELSQLKILCQSAEKAWIDKWGGENVPEQSDESSGESTCAPTTEMQANEKFTAIQHDAEGEGKDSTEIATLQAKLKSAQEEILKQSQEILSYQKTKQETDRRVSLGGSSDGQNDTSGDMSANSKNQNQILMDRIENMEPLYRVGVNVRARTVELHANQLRKMRGQSGRNDDVLNRGNEAHRLWNSKADSAMFNTLGQELRFNGTNFLDIYDVSMGVAWEHRKFTCFQNMLTWRADMVHNFKSYPSVVFMDSYSKLFKAIHPTFEISNDIAIQANAELREAYETLKTEHFNARKADKFSAAGPRRGVFLTKGPVTPVGPSGPGGPSFVVGTPNLQVTPQRQPSTNGTS